jgi:hypothetical protein
MKKTTLTTLSLIATTLGAFAQVTTTFHSNGKSSITYGGSSVPVTFHSGGGSSLTYGNTTFHSNGTSSQTYGNTTFHSGGGLSTKYGNTTFHSNGTSSITYGNNTSTQHATHSPTVYQQASVQQAATPAPTPTFVQGQQQQTAVNVPVERQQQTAVNVPVERQARGIKSKDNVSAEERLKREATQPGRIDHFTRDRFMNAPCASDKASRAEDLFAQKMNARHSYAKQ